MALKHGKNTAVYLDGTDLSTYLNSAEFSVDTDTADTTTFQASWKTAIVGQSAAKADFNGLYDPTKTTLPDSIGDDFALTGGVLTVAPAGATAIGDLTRTMQIASTAYTESSPVGGVIAVKWSVIASAPVGFGWALHPLAEDTNTTTGAERDDTAATSTGWQAHLHVTAVDAGSWVVKLQDAAVSNTYSDVSGGAFTAATTAGGQRLLSASGATLRRYVRYVATRTGGSAGDGITFHLSYSRNF
jgi:hypothetical protein